MKIGLLDLDMPRTTNIVKPPNLALMKLSAFHKAKGDAVELTMPVLAPIYDQVYASKVFTWTELPPLPEGAVLGGSGVDLVSTLPDEVESICPDYSLYGLDYSMGFLTRGCIRKCPWCLVPEKEGKLRPAADIEDFLRHGKAVLLDNNVLAHPWGIKQIEKIAKLGVRVDFNQGLDARLIDDAMARLLAKVKWLEPVRLACDTAEMMPTVQRAVEAMRWQNVIPRRYSCYVLVQDIGEALERVRFLKGMDLIPFAQPYRPPSGDEPTPDQRRFSRWVNHRAIFKTVEWQDYNQ